MATIAGRGQAQAWDLATGEIHPISGATAEGDSVRFPLVLGTLRGQGRRGGAASRRGRRSGAVSGVRQTLWPSWAETGRWT